MSLSSARLPPVQFYANRHEISVIPLLSTDTYERLKPSGPMTLFSMKRLVRGPIAAYATEAKHRANKAKQERICGEKKAVEDRRK